MLNWYAEQGNAPWWIILVLAMLTFAGEMLGGEQISCNPAPFVERDECVVICEGLVREWNPHTCKCAYWEEEHDERQVH